MIIEHRVVDRERTQPVAYFTEEREVLQIIADNSQLNIVCVIDNDEMKEKMFKKAVEDKLEELSAHTGQFYKGTLRSGQMLESESSIIILGDINPGAKVIAKGNIIVLGSLKGTAYAGANGNEDAFVEDENIYIERLDKDVLDDIKL